MNIKRFTIICIIALAVVAAFTMCQAQDPAEKPDLEKLELQRRAILAEANMIQAQIQRTDAQLLLLRQERPQLDKQLAEKLAELQRLDGEIVAAGGVTILRKPPEANPKPAEPTVKSKE